MHITEVKTKDGKEFSGVLWEFKPVKNYFTIIDGDDSIKFSFDDVESVITKGERISNGIIGDQDEIERARQYLIKSREYSSKLGWDDAPIKKYDWE